MLTHVDNRITYNGNGNATEFAYQFKILDRTDIKVLLTDADGKEKLLTKDYYVDVEKSVVRYPGYAVGAEVPESERPAVLPTGWKLTIYREVPVTQETDLPDQYPFNQVEDIGDKLTMIAQQLTDVTGRSLKIGVSTSADIDTTIPFEAGKSFRIADDGKSIALTEDPARVREIVLAASDVAQAQARVATEQATVAVTSANAAKVSEQNAEKSKQRASDLANEAASSADRAATQSDIAGGHAAEAAKSAEEAAEKLTQLGEHEANAAASAKAAAKSAQDAASVERRTQENATAAEEHATAAKQNAEYTATLANEVSNAKDTILSESNSMRQYMSLTKENIDAAKNQTINAAASAGDYAAQAAQSATNAALAETNAAASKEAARSAASAANDLAAVAQDSADEARGYADSVKDVEQELRADNASLNTDLKHANRRISVLYDLGKGITHRYETDSDVAYSKDVPSGAKVMDVKMVGGKSVVENQLIQDVKFEGGFDVAGGAWLSSGTIKLSAENGTASFTVTNSWVGVKQLVNIVQNHRYYISAETKSDMGNNRILCPYVEKSVFGTENSTSTPNTEWNHYAVVLTAVATNRNTSLGVRASSKENGTIIGAKISCKNIQCVDLTQMFGAGNEPTLEEFEAMLTRPDYPYNAGTLVSADVTAVQVGDKVIPLPNSISLKSAGSVYDSLEFYEQDGKYYQRHTQRVGVVDLGTLTWNYTSNSNNQYRFYAPIANIKPNDRYDDVANCLCIKYQTDNANNVFNNVKDKTIAVPTKSEIWIHDSTYNNVGDFTTAMQGVLLYYELATPIVTVTEVDNRFDAVDCKAGDKITFVGNSDYHLPVPNEQEYLIALNEVTA